MFSSAVFLLAAGKICKNQLVTDGFWYVFTDSQAASCKHFHCRNCRFRVFFFFEADYWNDFQNYLVISKEQAKSLSFLSTKNKNLKTIRACTESTYLLLYALKKYSSHDTIP